MTDTAGINQTTPSNMIRLIRHQPRQQFYRRARFYILNGGEEGIQYVGNIKLTKEDLPEFKIADLNKTCNKTPGVITEHDNTRINTQEFDSVESIVREVVLKEVGEPTAPFLK